jgi:hypothetical protein
MAARDVIPDDVVNTAGLHRLLGGLPVSVRLLKSLGQQPAVVFGKGVYWRRSAVPGICEALCEHLKKISNQHRKTEA